MRATHTIETIAEWLDQKVSLHSPRQIAKYTSLAVLAQLGVAYVDHAPNLAEPAFAAAEVPNITPGISISTTTLPPETTTTSPPAETTTTRAPEPIPETMFVATGLTKSTTRGKVGADQSWPESNRYLPLPEGLSYGILGVTKGHPFETYNHLQELVTKFRDQGIEPHPYLNTSLDIDLAIQQDDPNVPCPWQTPAEATALCPAYRWGYRGGIFAVEAAWEAKIAKDVWYLDVEGGPGLAGNKWSTNKDLNHVALFGTMDAVRRRAAELNGLSEDAIYIAIYSNKRYWDHIMGSDFKLPGIHGWYAGYGPLDSLDQFCDDPQYNFTGGGVVMVQSTLDTPHGKLDFNRTC